MIQAILTDIEGTTTAISFVHQELFPYSAKALPNFLKMRWKEPKVQEIANRIAVSQELQAPSCEQITDILLSWIKEDRKETSLKTLQGMIWESGYQSGELKGYLYSDAYEWLKRWKEQGITLSVFSSGSVKAQKLLLGHSTFGDLTPLFTAHFDTNVGSKREVQSYQKIRSELGVPAEKILFSFRCYGRA